MRDNFPAFKSVNLFNNRAIKSYIDHINAIRIIHLNKIERNCLSVKLSFKVGEKLGICEIANEIIPGTGRNNPKLNVRITGGTVNYLVDSTVTAYAYKSLPILSAVYHRTNVLGGVPLAGGEIYTVATLALPTSFSYFFGYSLNRFSGFFYSFARHGIEDKMVNHNIILSKNQELK
jgi:hypothetical protein